MEEEEEAATLRGRKINTTSGPWMPSSVDDTDAVEEADAVEVVKVVEVVEAVEGEINDAKVGGIERGAALGADDSVAGAGSEGKGGEGAGGGGSGP